MRLPWRAAFVAVFVASVAVASAPSDAHGYTFVWPTKGRITQPFGCTGFSWEPRRGDCRHFHSGIDIANKAGTPIRAATSGVVTLAGYNPYDRPGDRAWVVVIKHDAGFTGWYAHMQAKYVSGVRAGRRVKAGQLIGYMGNTGRSTGVHLHFAFIRNGVAVNPKKYLPAWRSTSVSSTSRTSSTTRSRERPASETGRRHGTPVKDAQLATVVSVPVGRLVKDYWWIARR